MTVQYSGKNAGLLGAICIWDIQLGQEELTVRTVWIIIVVALGKKTSSSSKWAPMYF